MSLLSNMCLPSKHFTDPSGFCGAETNVKKKQIQRKRFGFWCIGF